MSALKLIDVVTNLKTYDETLTIYVTEPWTCDSEAVLAIEPDEGGLPDEAKSRGAEYFIEVFVATEFLVSLIGRKSAQELCERLIYYALHDS